jgi:hypothetical protein
MGRGKQFCLLYVALLLLIVAIFESFAQCRPIEEAAVKAFVGQGDRGPGLVDSIERPARGRDLLQRRSLPSLTDERETREEERANNETNPFVDDPLVCCCQSAWFGGFELLSLCVQGLVAVCRRGCLRKRY